MTRVIEGIAELESLVGTHLGFSNWWHINQERINVFADVTDDHQWIHVDPEKAKEGPFGTTIAHGYLTLSLGPAMAPEVFTINGLSMAINYGCGKVRFPTPVPVNSNLRLGVEVKEVAWSDDTHTQAQLTMLYTFEVEGADKPSCVAEVITRIYA